MVPWREQCIQLASQLGIGDKVRFFGFVPRQEVEKFYAAADLFTFTSVTETQGLVVQEAMQHGLPAVAMLGGGAAEAIIDQENGLITRNDADQFALSTLKALEDQDLYEHLCRGAIETARENSVEMMVDRIIDVYERAVRREPSEVKDQQRILI